MLNEFWSQLKSGTDIRGVAVEGAGFEVNLDEKTAAAIVNGFIVWLCKKTGKNAEELIISLGRDSRISGPALAAAARTEIVNSGATVLDCSLASTPSMFMTTVDAGADGAIQLTASHHPYYRNGLKFFTRDGGLEGSDIESVLTLAQNGEKPDRSEREGKIINSDFMSRYAYSLREMIKKGVNSKDDYHHPLKGMRIIVDAGNGVGGFYAGDVLELLGADVRGSQFLEPDGRFPNHIPNPEDKDAMASICDAVKANGADLGVIFDTDVDRAGAVDSEGNEINRNRLVALASAIALEGNEGGTIVTDSITSGGLHDFIESDLGGVHLRYRRGYKNVIDEAVRQNANGVNCPLAIETSGHAAMRENYFLDDGAYLVTKIIIKAVQLRNEGKSLKSLIEGLKEPVESREIRIKINDKDFRTYGQKVIDELTKYSEKQKTFKIADDNHEGIRVSFDKRNGDGWFLLRLSVHDPIMPLNIESDSKGGVDKIYKKIEGFLEGCEGLDTYKKPAAKKPDAKTVKAEEPKAAAKAEKSDTKLTVKKEEPKAIAKTEKKETKLTVKKEEPKAIAKTEKKETKLTVKKEEPKAIAKTEKKEEPKAAKTEKKEKPKVAVKAEKKEEPKAAAKTEKKEEPKAAAKTEKKATPAKKTK